MSGSALRRPRGSHANRELVDLAATLRGTSLLTPMDLVHITSVGWARRIISDSKLEVRRCKVFEKDLIYAFLARPAYRFRDGDTKSHQINRFPFVFVLSPARLPAPYHVYPFDTGAFMGGVYGNAADPTVFLEDYALEPTVDAALLHVAWAFGTRAAYFEGKLKTDLANTLPTWRSVGRGWIDIACLAGTGSDRPDARASAVELAYGQTIDLRQGHVQLAILPQQLLEDPRGDNTDLQDRINALGFAVKTYNWRANETPDSFMEEITHLVRKYLEEINQL